MFPAFDFDDVFASLGSSFGTTMPPEAVAKAPFLIAKNNKGAKLIGMSENAFSHPDFPAYFSGNKTLPESQPLAMVYSGHQFGQWAGQLGDGRALLLGQVRNTSGELWDIQLKGSGKTPYSRMGDGRAVLRSCIREFLCGEAMAALHIPTTRSLCIVGTGQPVFRETAEPGAVFTRLARSHIRFGHFEHFNAREQFAEVKVLADHVMAEYFPHLKEENYEAWFAEIVTRTAQLMARWQAVGFAHGVMNTDNMSILGDTLDYGPFGFMEAFEPDLICNHSDHTGRYAFSQQPSIGLWNLHALAYALHSLLPQEFTAEILHGYEDILIAQYENAMRRKTALTAENDTLWHQLLRMMAEQKTDYTNTFRALADSFENPEIFLSLFSDGGFAQAWLADYHHAIEYTELTKQHLRAVNPKYILRNWVAESVIRAAEDQRDYAPIADVLQLLQNPFDEHESFDHFSKPAPEAYRELSVSCSS